MSISFLDPTYPARLPSRRETLDFTVVGTDPDALTISLRYADGFLETIYQQGLIGRGYTVTRDGSGNRTFHVARRDPWPDGRFSLPVSEGPASAALPQLQPLNYSPFAAWDMDGNGPYPNRVDPTKYQIDSPPFSHSVSHRSGAHTSIYGNLGGLAGPDFNALNALTVTFKYFSRVTPVDTMIIGVTIGTSGYVTNWEILDSGSDGVSYFSGNPYGAYTQVGSGYYTGPIGPTWRFVSLRRNLAKTSVRLGLDGVFSPALTVTAYTPHPACGFRIGARQTNPFINGGFEDLMIWDRELTDVELTAQYKTSMGVP